MVKVTKRVRTAEDEAAREAWTAAHPARAPRLAERGCMALVAGVVIIYYLAVVLLWAMVGACLMTIVCYLLGREADVVWFLGVGLRIGAGACLCWYGLRWLTARRRPVAGLEPTRPLVTVVEADVEAAVLCWTPNGLVVVMQRDDEHLICFSNDALYAAMADGYPHQRFTMVYADDGLYSYRSEGPQCAVDEVEPDDCHMDLSSAMWDLDDGVLIEGRLSSWVDDLLSVYRSPKGLSLARYDDSAAGHGLSRGDQPD